MKIIAFPRPLAELRGRGRAFACIFFVSDNHKHPSLTAAGRPLATNHKKGCRLKVASKREQRTRLRGLCRA
ncbi:MAG: hypothetical protein LBQ31_10395 [Bacteroidales bacterium]|nr:hypothetical protein [Bacteroidales bacterium]